MISHRPGRRARPSHVGAGRGVDLRDLPSRARRRRSARPLVPPPAQPPAAHPDLQSQGLARSSRASRLSGVYSAMSKRRHPLYEVWRGMMARCYRPRAHGYANYGGRGIVVCLRWHDFWLFVEDIPLRPSREFSLDRKDNNGNYEPGNVRWATRKQQARNTRFNRKLAFDGKTQTLEEWALELGFAKSTLFNRLRRGWSDERTLATKPQAKAPSHSLQPPRGAIICKAMGIARETVSSRLRRGWTFEDAISKPVDHRRNRHANTSAA